MDKIPIYILAGGRSSRFGSDKARALTLGRPLVLHVAEALASRASRLTVVAEREEKYTDLGLRTVADLTPGLGPLGGLHTALLDQDEPGWLLLCSCDWVGLSPAWVDQLLEARTPSSSAIAYKGTVWEPLLGLYRGHDRLRSEVTARLDDGRLALWRLLEDLPARALPLPADWGQARQVNRPVDLDGAGGPGAGRL